MDDLVPRAPSGDLEDRYAALPAGQKLVMRLKSLIFLPTNKSTFQQCLARSGLRGPDGRAWSPPSLNDAIERLRRQGLLTDEAACHPALLHTASIDAAASADRDALIAAVRSSFPIQRHYGYVASASVDCNALMRQVRLAIYANDAPVFTAYRELYRRHCYRFLIGDVASRVFGHSPITPDWLASRAEPIQIALLETKLNVMLQQGVAGPDLPALVSLARTRQDADGFAGLRPTLASYALLTDQLDECRRSIATIDPATADHPAWEGVLAFLEGRNDAAIERFRTALKLHRKALGKRKIFLDGLPSIFFLMALLHAGDPRLQPEIQNALEASLGPDTIYAGAILAMQTLLWLTQGLENKARDLLKRIDAAVPSEPLSAACIGLAQYAVDAALARTHRADMAKRFERLRDVLPLIARMHAEVLAGVADRPDPYAAYLAQTAPAIEIAFTRLLTIGQPWERALESLMRSSATQRPSHRRRRRRARPSAWCGSSTQTRAKSTWSSNRSRPVTPGATGGPSPSSGCTSEMPGSTISPNTTAPRFARCVRHRAAGPRLIATSSTSLGPFPP